MSNRRFIFKFLFVGMVAALFIAGAAWMGYDYYLSLPCPKEKPLRDAQTWFCHTCDSDEKIQLDATSKLSFKEQCAVCPNRQVDRYLGFYCVLKCPSDKPLRDFYDECHACTNPARVYVGYAYESVCGICSEREFNHGFCFKKCPPDKPYRDYNGKCYAEDEI